jgi:phosphatidate cytidylyltransferase
MSVDLIHKQNRNLKQRIIFGFLGFFLMLFGMLGNEWSYFVVFLIIHTLSLTEFYYLLEKYGYKPMGVLGILIGTYLYLLTFAVEKQWLSVKLFAWVVPIASFGFAWKLYDKNDTQPLINAALSVFGVFYISLPFTALHLAVFNTGSYSYQVVVGLFFLIWINDISAYFIGSGYGKHKLFERISPKKSWEGWLGGLVACSVLVFLLSEYLQDLSLLAWGGVAFIVVIWGTYGDLIESSIKRSLQIKDSGETIPGHGGFLDRFDSFLLTAPWVAAWLWWVQ